MTIGEKIKTLRKEKDYTQEELAEYAGAKKQTIHKYETGIIENIPASKVKLIAEKLDTTPCYLMGWGDECQVEQNSNDIQNIIHTPQEISFLNKYTQLNDIGKEKAETYIDDLLDNSKYRMCETEDNSFTDHTISLREAMEIQKPRPVRSDRLNDDGYERIAAFGRGVGERKKK